MYTEKRRANTKAQNKHSPPQKTLQDQWTCKRNLSRLHYIYMHIQMECRVILIGIYTNCCDHYSQSPAHSVGWHSPPTPRNNLYTKHWTCKTRQPKWSNCKERTCTLAPRAHSEWSCSGCWHHSSSGKQFHFKERRQSKRRAGEQWGRVVRKTVFAHQLMVGVNHKHIHTA